MPLAYVIRSCNQDMTSHGGFVWPKSGAVECPDWSPAPVCGQGLHGLLWGIGDWSLCNMTTPGRVWLVVAVEAESVVKIGEKVKFPKGEVIYCGGMPGAMSLIAEKRLIHLASLPTEASTAGYGAPASTAGDDAPASTAGDGAPASTAGDGAPASTAGDDAPASTAGYGAPASTAGARAPASTAGDDAPASTAGDDAPASTAGDGAPASTAGARAPASTAGDGAPASTAGDGAPASTAGKNSPAACLGTGGRAKAGAGGSLIVSYLDSSDRLRHAVGYVGEDGILADVWYVVRNGALTALKGEP